MTDDRILIIDDDAETASFLQSAFSRAGVSSETVNDAFAAMDKLREHAYCAVVLDPMIRHRGMQCSISSSSKGPKCSIDSSF